MTDRVAAHYQGPSGLVETIAAGLQAAGKTLGALETTDLSGIDEFHVRGREATLELAERLGLGPGMAVLDIGCGLGGPARAVAETRGCHVTGIDLTPAFCEAAAALSEWVGLGGRVAFRQGDATALPYADDSFDAAMTLHAAMNVAAKDRMYAEARRVLKPGGRFGAYDVLQGEGGEVHYPVPWAREPSISHLATRAQMESLLADAGFAVIEVRDSTAESQDWFAAMAARLAETGPPPVSFAMFLGEAFPEMVRNQLRNLAERRIRTVGFVCAA